MSSDAFYELSDQLNSIPSHLFSIYHQNSVTGKYQYKYDEKIRRFAISVLFKSPAAYRYVRKTLGKVLPSASTIRRWCSKTDCSPGFNDTSFTYLKHKVDEYKSKGSKLLLSLAVDEMSIRKGWLVTGTVFSLLLYYKSLL